MPERRSLPASDNPHPDVFAEGGAGEKEKDLSEVVIGYSCFICDHLKGDVLTQMHFNEFDYVIQCFYHGMCTVADTDEGSSMESG
jgi:hypothetical protein